jgi:hypothetical protein
MAVLSKAIYMFGAIPIKIPMDILHRDWKIYPKVHLETQKTTNNQGNTEQKEQCWRYHNTQLYRAITKKSAWYWHKNRHEDQRNRVEDPDMSPGSYAYLIFNKGAQNTWQKKDSFFNKCCWENWISVCSKLKLDLCLSPGTSINSEWIKDLNVRPKLWSQCWKEQGIHWN